MEKNNKTLNVPHLRFPEFSGEWERKSLSDLVIRVTRKNKNNESRLPLTISAQYGLVDQISFFNKVVASNDMSNYYLLHKGEFAYNKSYSGDYPWGAIKRLDRYEKGALSSLYICFAPQKVIHSDFLVHYFESPKWHKAVSNIAGEGARNHGLLNIAVPDFFNTRHWVPSNRTEQEKIAALFNLIEERIQTQKKIIEKYESLIKGIVEIHHSNCTHLQQVHISELGQTFSTMNLSKEDLTEEGHECILYGELFTTYGCVIRDIKSRTQISEAKPTISRSNDLLFPASTTVDAISLIAPSAICKAGVILGGDLFGIHVNENYNNEYLSYLINYIYKSKLARYAQGSTIIHLHYSDIKNATLLLPTIDEQNHLACLMRSVEAKIIIEKDMLSKLHRQKAYLLSSLFI